MSTAGWLRALAAHGVELWFEGERLRFRAPRGALRDEDRAALSARRAEVVAHLREQASHEVQSFPLSYSQRSLWFLHQQAPESAAYHVALPVRVRSRLDAGALAQAVQALVDRHPSLRTTYAVEEGAPRQRVAGAVEALVEVEDATALDEAALCRRVREVHHRRFDLARGPVLRTTLFRRAEQDHVLLLSVHHIAADGWSLLLLLDELTRLYAEAAGGAPANLPRPETTYAEHAAWQERLLAGPAGERWLAAWRERLTPPPAPLALPTDRPRPRAKGFRGASLPAHLAEGTVARLRELAQQEGTTPFVALLATYTAFLARLSGADDLVVGTPAFARSRPEVMRVVGDFVNSLPLRLRCPADATLRSLIRAARPAVLDALEAQELPLPLLVERLQPGRDASRSPLFDAFFTVQRFEAFGPLEGLLAGGGAQVEVAGLRLESFPIDQQEGQFDLALQLLDRGGAVQGVLKYDSDLFDEPTARGFAEDWAQLAAAAAADPDAPIAAMPAPRAARVADARRLLARLRARDVRLALDGDRLKVNAPRGALDEAARAELAASKEALVEVLRREAAEGDGPRRLSPGAPAPLSASQRRLWFMDRMDPGRPHYNVGGAVRLLGPLDPSRMASAVDAVVRRHPSLRTRYAERDGAPVALVDEELAVPLEVVDLSELPVEAREAEAARRARERLRAPFDLTRGPLAGFLLTRVAPDDHRLSIAAHHIAVDGWSLAILVRELLELYGAAAEGRAPRLASLPIQYGDYAAWEAERQAAGALAQDLAWWTRELAGVPALLELPTDRPRPPAQSFRGRRVRRVFGEGLFERISALAQAHDATPFMVMLAALQVVLHRHAGQDDVVVGSPVANRDRRELEGIVGCFVNQLALRGRLGGNPTFAELLAQVRRTVLGALEHAALPFDAMVEALRPPRSADHAPVYQVLFAYQSFPNEMPAPAGLRLDLGDVLDIGTARFDLALDVGRFQGRFIADWEWATDLFDESTIHRLHGELEQALRAAADDPTRRVEALPLLPDAERGRLAVWNATTLEHDRGRCLHDLLEATARRTPDAVAVEQGGAALTYRALDSRANRLAHLLLARGARPGGLVALCLDRTLDLPVAVAAVAKTGAAYVPLDPTHPADRLRYCLSDAGASCAVTVARHAPLLAGAGAELLLLDEAEAALAAQPETRPDVSVRPDDRAYVIYTSGSTGRPKGVEVEHRNVVAFLEAMRREPGLGPADAVLAVTTLSFDIAGLELWLPLAVGARVVVARREEAADGARLAALLEAHGITLLQATPATWRLLLEAGWAGRPGLTALCGGEALPRDVAEALLPRVAALWNMYGPTETTIWSTLNRVRDPADTTSIGRPIANTRAYVVEPGGDEAPVGVAGELWLAGEGVARGYHERPELTAERFVELALPDRPRERAYRTGDMARRRADGRLDFLGRRDHQVKVRGYRIELGEIETVLSGAPGVRACAAAVREDRPGDQRLVAYVVADPGAPFDAEAARAALRATLPEYMVPGTFAVLPALPLTPNGKVDRKALPAPVSCAPASGTSAQGDDEALMSPEERRVAAAWREVLRVERVGLGDNFFDLGGHSLLLVKLQAALRHAFGAGAEGLQLVELFQWTTVAGQAARLTGRAAPGSAMDRARARAARLLDG